MGTSGVQNLAGSNTFTGGIAISSGTLEVSGATGRSLGGSPVISFGASSGSANATIQFAGNTTANYASPINTIAGSTGIDKIWDFSSSSGFVLSGSIGLANNLTIINTNGNGSVLATTGLIWAPETLFWDRPPAPAAPSGSPMAST